MSPLAEKFSFCVWIKKIIPTQYPIAFAYAESELYIYDHGGYRLFKKHADIKWKSTPQPWYQFCGTWSLASRTFRAYQNGTVVHTMVTDPGRKLKTGGELLLGDYWNPLVKGPTNNHFGGEMYNLNFFSKELSAVEVAELSENGLCTPVPEKLNLYRVIRWEEILELERSGNVQDIDVGCEVSD